MQALPRGLILVLTLAAETTFANVIVVEKSSKRVTLSLNGPWTVEGPGLSDTLNVPQAIPFTFGTTTWTRTFSLALTAPPRVAYLELGGLVNTAVVRLNGIEVGRLLAFTHTLLDVGAALVWNGENTLEVQIDDRLTTFTVPGGPTEYFVDSLGPLAYTIPVAWENKPGIIREVAVIHSPKPVITHVFAKQDFAPDLDRATVQFRVRVRGAPPAGVGALVGLTMNGVYAGGCLAGPFDEDELSCTITLDSPNLWSVANPQLYDLWATLFDGTGVVDAVRDRIGLRRIETRGNQLYLNNQPLFLRGITRHDLYGDSSFVADAQTMADDLTRIKALGVNFIRSIHYPPHPLFSRLADEMGILLSEEIPAWAVTRLPEVRAKARDMFVSMVERDFNRPSVIMWFTGNGAGADGEALHPEAVAAVRPLESQRPMAYIFDDLARATDLFKGMTERVALARRAGMDFFALNVGKDFYPPLANLLPIDMPVMAMEWAGSEGSDRGPIGEPGVKSFPGFPDVSGQGVFSELYQAWTIWTTFTQFYAYTRCVPDSPCLAGMAFFNWQDFVWPGFPLFNKEHFSLVQSGLVYEDRVGKELPLQVFGALMSLLPQ